MFYCIHFIFFFWIIRLLTIVLVVLKTIYLVKMLRQNSFSLNDTSVFLLSNGEIRNENILTRCWAQCFKMVCTRVYNLCMKHMCLYPQTFMDIPKRITTLWLDQKVVQSGQTLLDLVIIDISILKHTNSTVLTIHKREKYKL